MSSSPCPRSPNEVRLENASHSCSADPYAWLRDRDDPRVHAHIEAQNALTGAFLTRTAPLRGRIFEEMLARVDLSRCSPPVPHGPYEYFSRFEEDKAYAIHCRRRRFCDDAEEIILDENLLAEGHGYFSLGFLSVSPDHERCLFGVDICADERFAVFVRSIAHPAISVAIPGSYGNALWSNDRHTLYSVRLDAYNRPFQLVRHRVEGTSVFEENIFEEKDAAYQLRLSRTEDGRFLILTSWARDTTELRYLDADDPNATVKLLYPRRNGIEAYVTHHEEKFYIVTNEEASANRILTMPTKNQSLEKRIFRDAPADVEIDWIHAFAKHIVICERRRGIPTLHVVDMQTNEDHVVDLPESVIALYPEDNREFETEIFRFGYSSFVTPYTVFNYDMAYRRLDMLQQSAVVGYNPTDYASERIFVPTGDGVDVPMSLVYRKGRRNDGSHPALLYGYGAYGFRLEAEFSSLRLSLLDRGFVYAVAHVRGGGELGRDWHEQGQGRLKQNSIGDFIACAEYLIREGFVHPGRLGVMGESAGGLLAAAAINQRPELFSAVVTDGPFVDVINTLADETLPFTISEWKEWGNPSMAKDRAWLQSYSPYENVRRQAYPSLLVFCSLNDPRVPYWEGLKWAERIREMSSEPADILVKVRLDGGHQGMSDRFAEVEEWASIYAFLIERLTASVGG
ncbi:S9 family peptidase [Methylocystis sp. JAN1]|uniref:S9 family peptidase n=1 Tax=Methylocystis sp. JAN1 TaxID=3397211 RepID=UPI003FA27191